MGYIVKLKFVALCAVMLFSLQSCDWIKGQMGMPTSNDIARMKAELQEKEALEREQLARAKFVEDSLAQAALVEAEIKVEGYHVIIGSFKDYKNADALEKLVKDLGYKPQQIPFKNGYMMVSIGNTITLQEAVALMTKVNDLDACPYDVWVYSAKQGLHIEE